MTETPVADDNGPETAAQTRSAYLAVLPKDWEYNVEIRGKGGERITVAPSEIGSMAAQGVVTVTVTTGETRKQFNATSLKDGAKAAVNAAKALAQIAEHEKSAADAKQKLLDTIGVEVDDEPKAAKNGKPAGAGATPPSASSAER